MHQGDVNQGTDLNRRRSDDERGGSSPRSCGKPTRCGTSVQRASWHYAGWRQQYRRLEGVRRHVDQRPRSLRELVRKALRLDMTVVSDTLVASETTASVFGGPPDESRRKIDEKGATSSVQCSYSVC